MEIIEEVLRPRRPQNQPHVPLRLVKRQERGKIQHISHLPSAGKSLLMIFVHIGALVEEDKRLPQPITKEHDVNTILAKAFN